MTAGNGEPAEVAPWLCAGCGKAADGQIKPCDCVTMVGYRRKGDGLSENIAFTRPPLTAASQIAQAKQIFSEPSGLYDEDGIWQAGVTLSAALSRAEALLAEAREAALKVRSPTETPQTPDGQDRFYIVIVKRGHNGKAYTFPAVHLHNYPLLYIDEDEPIPTTGWYSYGSSEDGEAVNYEKLIGHKGDELLGWAEIPDLAAALLAKLEQG